jgi:hypothetical protein
MDVVHSHVKVPLVADVAIPILPHPYPWNLRPLPLCWALLRHYWRALLPPGSALLHQKANPPPGIALPRLHDLGQRYPFVEPHQDVHMVGHHHPGNQVVALPGKVPPGIDYARRRLGQTQHAGAVTGV